jgi:hypothetical protein
MKSRGREGHSHAYFLNLNKIKKTFESLKHAFLEKKKLLSK